MSLSERRVRLRGGDQITALTLAQEKVLDAFASRSRRRKDVMVAFLQQRAEQQQRVLFDDEWVSPDQSRRGYRRLRNRQLLQMLELLAVMAALIGGAALCFGLLMLLYW